MQLSRDAQRMAAQLSPDVVVMDCPLPDGDGLTATAAIRDHDPEVLQLLAEGLSTRDIAERLVLSISTVRNHVQNILSKLDAHSRLEAVSVAMRQGIVGRPD